MNQVRSQAINPLDFISENEGGAVIDWRKIQTYLDEQFHCDCDHIQVFRRKLKNNTVIAGQACVTCHRWKKNVSSRNLNLDTLCWYDPELRDNRDLQQAQMRERIQVAVQDFLYEEREQQRQERTLRYHQYLQTAEWKVICRKVHERANGICEGCRERPSQEVHHLTYDRIFNEMLFDLVALCSPCHRSIHKDKTRAG